MRAWSGMAVAALLAAGSIAALGGKPVHDDPPASRSAAPRAGSSGSTEKATPFTVPLVKLQLSIAGLTSRGCDVQVKPGSPNCEFKLVSGKRETPSIHVDADGHAWIELRDVKVTGADRTCLIAVVVHEPGQPDKTIHRGFRLPAKASKDSSSSRVQGSAPVFNCYISSPSQIARTQAIAKSQAESRTK